ncbi:hypothetical protein JOD54_006213 [Actinokineospora baliensis]|uniref:DUF397 domain-containing protein n=1 Tax=Actinokineospora baliensis TaxID=547056 RepID=UPI001956EB8B|nr:DUF397 domain-containing protein [Actinokineospora baliensis]MBM7776009.1 hypothetical protein [Actinokineospora baliensis]
MRYEDAVTALAAATNWHKSTHSGGQNGGCVEVGSVPGLVGVRDTKLGSNSPTLAFSPVRWAAFTDSVRCHQLDL